jgi:hypothetical protein
MAKYDETRAKQILESAADALSPDLEARRTAARELIKEIAQLAGATRIRTVTASDSKARLSIGEHGVNICYDGLAWELHPDGSTPITLEIPFDPHEKKFAGDAASGKDGLAVLLEAAMDCMKNRRQAEAVERSLGNIRDLMRH